MIVRCVFVGVLFDVAVAFFLVHFLTDPDSAVAMSSANGLVGTGFASRYQLQPRACF